MKEIYEKNKSGITMEKLAIEYGCSEGTIRRRLKLYKKQRQGGRKKIRLPINIIAKRYGNGETIEELRREYHISYDTMEKRLKEYYIEKGIEMPKQETKYSDKDELEQMIVEFTKNHKTIEEIALETGKTHKSVYSFLRNRLGFKEFMKATANIEGGNKIMAISNDSEDEQKTGEGR